MCNPAPLEALIQAIEDAEDIAAVQQRRQEEERAGGYEAAKPPKHHYTSPGRKAA